MIDWQQIFYGIAFVKPGQSQVEAMVEMLANDWSEDWLLTLVEKHGEYWRTGRGQAIPLEYMTREHLYNCLNYMRPHRHENPERWGKLTRASAYQNLAKTGRLS